MGLKQEQDRERGLDAVAMLQAIEDRDLDGLYAVMQKYGHPENPDFLGLFFGFGTVAEMISGVAELHDEIPYGPRLDLIEHGLRTAEL